MFTAAVAFLPSGCRMLMLSCPRCQATWDPPPKKCSGWEWRPRRGRNKRPNHAPHMTFKTPTANMRRCNFDTSFLAQHLIKYVFWLFNIKQLLRSKNSERFLLLSAQNAISPDKEIIPYVTTQFSFLNRPVLRLRRWLMLGLSRSVTRETMQQKWCGSWHVTPD